jgi:hypothetical protein
MINEIFDWCVQFLVFWAGRLGISYKAINVWVFVIIWPVFTLLLIVLIIVQQVKIRRLQRNAKEIKNEDGSNIKV